MSKNIAAGYLDMCADHDGKYSRGMVERIIAVAYSEGKFDGIAQSARHQMDSMAVVHGEEGKPLSGDDRLGHGGKA